VTELLTLFTSVHDPPPFWFRVAIVRGEVAQKLVALEHHAGEVDDE
jgi:hypothetical protein